MQLLRLSVFRGDLSVGVASLSCHWSSDKDTHCQLCMHAFAQLCLAAQSISV